MKLIICVVTFAAAQLQVKNLRLREPAYAMLSETIPLQINPLENTTTTAERFSLSFLILGLSVIGSAVFLIGKKLRTSHNQFATT